MGATSIYPGGAARQVVQVSHMLVKIERASGGVGCVVAQAHSNAHMGILRYLQRLAAPLAQGVAVAVSHHAKIFAELILAGVDSGCQAGNIKDRCVVHACIQQAKRGATR